MDAETAYQIHREAPLPENTPQYETIYCSKTCFLAGYHARDVEIERLRAGIKELCHICDGTGGYEGESARARLEMGGDKCDELLKGGG